MSDTKITKSKCNKCNQETKHTVRASYIQKDSEMVDQQHQFEIYWSYNWEILECRGCDNIHVKMTHWFSEWDGVDIQYYPAVTSKRKPDWVEKLEDEILKNLFNELYIAHEADIRFSTTNACRTIIERVMSLKVGPQGTFKNRLKKLASEGFISNSDTSLIDTALEAGHASAHRGWSPKESYMMDTVIGITENLVEKLFVLPNLSEKLKKDIPKRES